MSKCSCQEKGTDGTSNHTGLDAILKLKDKEIITSCQNHIENHVHMSISKGLKAKEVTVEHVKKLGKMKVDRALMELLCQCEKFDCEKPHTMVELAAEMSPEEFALKSQGYKPEVKCPRCFKTPYTYLLNNFWAAACLECDIEMDIMEDGSISVSEESVEKPKTKCPTCYREVDPDSIWEFEGEWWAYCGVCSITFEAETGKVWNFSQTDKAKSVTPSKSITTTAKFHHMNQDKDQIYICDSCKFQTSFINDVIKHEKIKVGEDPHWCKFVSNNLWRCIFCQREFTTWAETSNHENDVGKRIENGYSTTTTTTYVHCTHNPTKVLNCQEEGWEMWAGRRIDCESKLSNFDIILNLTGFRQSKKHEIPFPELKIWEFGSKKKYEEMCLDWPDHGVVDLPIEFWQSLHKLLKKKGAIRLKESEKQQQKIKPVRLITFCIGGHGRTGTAVASMLVAAFGWTPEAATTWIWENYCNQAIETNGQISYVYELVGQKYNPPKEEKETKKETSIQQGSIYGGWGGSD